MSFLSRVMNTLRRRDEERDAFSDDEGFEDFEDDDETDDTETMPMGRKIAFGMSGLLFVLLAGGGAAVWYLGKDAPPPPMAMAALGDLKVEEDEPAKPAAPAAATPAPAPAKPGAAPAPTANNIAATDKSTDRRPWLTNPTAQPPAAAKPGA